MGIQILQDGSIVDTNSGYQLGSVDDGEEQDPTPVATPARPAPKAREAIAKTVAPKLAPSPDAGFNVVKEAKKRRRFLHAEIKKLRLLEKELAQLDRLIAAAERPLEPDSRFTNVQNLKRAK